MTIEVKVPQLPESVADATLISWHKAPGDAVNRDESLVELETDKVVLEVPAPASGVIREIKVQNGATVRAGELLAVLEPGAVAAATATPAPAAPAAAAASAEGTRVAGKAGPAARRLAAESGVDLAAIAGSGRGGRVLKADVSAAGAAPPATAPPAAPAVSDHAPGPGVREERRVPMSRLRARIAQRMVEAQQNAAMLTTFNEVDLGEVMTLRSRHREAFEKRYGTKLGFMSFFVKASLEALRRFPVINASVEGSDIVYHEYYDIGIAVSTDRGLIVPVLRDADQLAFGQIEAAIAGFGRKAREGSIGMEDLTGGTFTITNGGIFGSLLSTPILNPPQSAILGMHKIQERPMAVNGQVAVRPMMYLALTYDHRIIDGREAVQFLVAVKEALEDPGRLLLQV
jgi:2-oxoglutarate dehydrogenase E2 component (dihydrolipoamide succinyltransferase)